MAKKTKRKVKFQVKKAKHYKYIVEVVLTMNKKSLKKDIADWMISTIENEAFVEGWSHDVDKVRIRSINLE